MPETPVATNPGPRTDAEAGHSGQTGPMTRLRRTLGGWAALIAVLLLFPLPFAVFWSLLDGLQFWSWHEAARTAVLAYIWELGGLALLLLWDWLNDKADAWAKRQS